MKISYLGPKGTFTEEVLHRYDVNNEYEKISCDTIDCAIDHCKKDCDYALVPVENSLGGSVITTLDYLMEHEDVTIVKEFIMPINHYLYGKQSMPLEKIEKIYSHGQALRQCSTFLREKLAKAQLVVQNSTAEGAKTILNNDNPYDCIIGSSALATAYPLTLLAGPIQNRKENWTRFLLLQRKVDEGYDYNLRDGKLSLICQLDGLRPGALYEALGVFAHSNINLVHIESRPLGRRLGEYKFFFDLEIKDGNAVKQAVDELAKIATEMIVMGVYPLIYL